MQAGISNLTTQGEINLLRQYIGKLEDSIQQMLSEFGSDSGKGIRHLQFERSRGHRADREGSGAGSEAKATGVRISIRGNSLIRLHLVV
jgi:hypothetical protein